MIDGGRCVHVLVWRDGGGRCVAELQQPDPGHVRGACARLTRLLYRFRPIRNLGGVFRCEEGRLLAIVLQLILPLVCSSFCSSFLSLLCAFVLVQVIRSGGARLGQPPLSMAAAAMILGACAATMLACQLACGYLMGLCADTPPF